MPRSKLGNGWLWMALALVLVAIASALAGFGWLSLVARPARVVPLVKTEGRGQPAMVPAPGPMAARLMGSAGLDQSQRVELLELLQGTEWLSPPSRGRFISCGGLSGWPLLGE